MEQVLVYVVNTILGIAIGWLTKRYKEGRREAEQLKQDNEILKQGFQALLRNAMVKDYNHYMDKGYMPIYAKDSFEAVYQAYHRMGANGVMDDIHTKAMAMPTEKEND